jgi:hypothetical protein
MKKQIIPQLTASRLVVWALLSSSASSQVKEIPKGGLEGIPQDAIEFAPEHDYRRENNLGLSIPAAAGVPPASTDPRNIEGNWINGRTYTINADGSYANTDGAPGQRTNFGRAGGPPGAAGRTGGPLGAGGAPQGPGGGRGGMLCSPGAPWSVGMPGRIIQAGKLIYVFKNGANNNYRRIELDGKHPASLTPTYGGHSIGHWEGNDLVIETVALKGQIAFGGMGGGGGAGGSYSPQTVVTERLHKFGNHMQIENFVTVSDPALKEPMVRRLTYYYRPDMKLSEAPCEEYDDPFNGDYATPTVAPVSKK